MSLRNRARWTRQAEVAMGAFLLLVLLRPQVASSGPAVDLHDLTWYVHVDLIDVAAGEDLPFWQSAIDAAVDTANVLLEGGQGPFDEPCCTRLSRTASVTTFGSTGDGLDVIDSGSDQAAIAAFGGSGSNAFLVDSISHCSGSAPSAIGCAWRPSCNGNGNDDPHLWMLATVESFDSGTLAIVVAHERGHNACLEHVSTAECQIMQGTIYTPGLGGCLMAGECTNYRAGRTTTSSGLECGCHDILGGLEPDGTHCSEVAAGGICSGGLCGAYDGGAAVQLVMAADPGLISGGPPDDSLRISALAGDWTNLGPYSGGSPAQVRAIAYAADSDTLYGVVPTVNDDSIVMIDSATGTILSFVGTIGNGADEIVSMAYDPGATTATGDDRLIVLEVHSSGSNFLGEFRWIDPASPSTANLLGSIVWNDAHLVTGLAYDSLQDKLFAASPFGPDGLYEVDLGSCPPSPCDMTQVSGARLFRDDASLSYSPRTGMLYLVGTVFGGARTFYDVIDPTTGTSVETLSLDVFTPAGLAAVPEPDISATLFVSALVIFVTASLRRRANPPGRE
ncbi:MAG: hypothetical protein CL908_04695 [Deltaproteobacteria bacterium]|nr:hypothetical protein [Deltaproteobacteria bacterium]